MKATKLSGAYFRRTSEFLFCIFRRKPYQEMKNFKLLRIVVSQIAFQARKVSEMGTSSLQCGRYTRLLIACASYFRFPTEASISTRPHAIDLIHDGRHVGFTIIMQISFTLVRGQTTQVREVITNILATQMICFTLIECLSPK